MIEGGYTQVAEKMKEGLEIDYQKIVTKVTYKDSGVKLTINHQGCKFSSPLA